MIEAPDGEEEGAIICRYADEELFRVEKDGFHYHGQHVEDAGVCYSLMMQFLLGATESVKKEKVS